MSVGSASKADSSTPKFLARTSRGVWANQSQIRNVSFSEKSPLSKASRNSTPSSRPWIECGSPEGKYQRSPALTSSIKRRPSSSKTIALTQTLF
jgi:hypothetical protein